MKHCGTIRAFGLAYALSAGCGKTATVAKIDGTASLGGKSVKISGCAIENYGDPPRTSAVVELEGGLRYMNTHDGPRVSKGGGDWTHPTCSRIASSLHTGDGWAQGSIGATCSDPAGELVIDVTLDCGVVDRPSPGKKRP